MNWLGRDRARGTGNGTAYGSCYDLPTALESGDGPSRPFWSEMGELLLTEIWE